MNRKLIHNVNIRMSFNFATSVERQNGILLSVCTVRRRIALTRTGDFKRLPHTEDYRAQLKSYRRLIIKKRNALKQREKKRLPLPINTVTSNNILYFNMKTKRTYVMQPSKTVQQEVQHLSSTPTRAFQIPPITITSPESVSSIFSNDETASRITSKSPSIFNPSAARSSTSTPINPILFYGRNFHSQSQNVYDKNTYTRTFVSKVSVHATPKRWTRQADVPADQVNLEANFSSLSVSSSQSSDLNNM